MQIWAPHVPPEGPLPVTVNPGSSNGPWAEIHLGAASLASLYDADLDQLETAIRVARARLNEARHGRPHAFEAAPDQARAACVWCGLLPGQGRHKATDYPPEYEPVP